MFATSIETAGEGEGVPHGEGHPEQASVCVSASQRWWQIALVPPLQRAQLEWSQDCVPGRRCGSQP
jgi:hypothetical protein